MRWSLIFGILLTCVPPSSYGQDAKQTNAETGTSMDENSAESTTVQITGVRNPEWKPYKFMLKGVETFEKKHSLAPSSELRFILLPRRDDVDMHGLKLSLEADRFNIPVPLAENNTFILPINAEARDANAELYLNRTIRSIKWFPHIRTPNLQPNERRLGDLRLECEVIWAIENETIPFAARMFVRAVGGPCGFSKGTFSFTEPKTIISATMTSGERRLKLPISDDGRDFTPPLHDKSWNDESRIYLEQKEPNRPNSGLPSE